MKYIRFLQEFRKEDIPLAGGKGANLGELVAAGMRVPQGCVLTVAGYRRCVPPISLPPLAEKDFAALERFTSEVQRQILGNSRGSTLCQFCRSARNISQCSRGRPDYRIREKMLGFPVEPAGYPLSHQSGI